MELLNSDKVIEQVARIAHEVNRGYCSGIGDDSQPPWDEAPAWQQESAIKGVRVAMMGEGPEAQHEAWMAEKQTEGWVYGDVKDEKAKTHPCMVPYHKLPPLQRAKDTLFQTTVRTTVAALGFGALLQHPQVHR